VLRPNEICTTSEVCWLAYKFSVQKVLVFILRENTNNKLIPVNVMMLFT
jgi:hypothetical protein